MAQGLCREKKKLGKEPMDSFFLAGTLIFWMFVLPCSDNWRCKLGLAQPSGCSKVVLAVTKRGQTLGKEEKSCEVPSAVQQGHHESRDTHLAFAAMLCDKTVNFHLNFHLRL